MNHADIFNTLTQIGLSQNEAKIYSSMLTRADFSALEAARDSEVPVQMVYRVLKRLHEKGLCFVVTSRPKRYSITDPDIAIEALIGEQQQILHQAEELKEEMHRLFLSGREHEEGLESIQILRDMDTALMISMTLNTQSREEILAFVKPPFLGGTRTIQKQVKALPPRRISKSMRLRAIYELSEETLKHTDQIEQSIKQSGEESRVIDSLPIKATIFDHRKVVFHLNVGDTANWKAVLMEHEQLAQTMTWLFNYHWDMATDYHEWKKSREL